MHGPVNYVADPSRGVQDFLHEIYERQREYHKKNEGYAKSLEVLGIKNSPLGTPTLEVTRHGFEASLIAPRTAGGKLWTIAQDCRIWSQ